MTHIPNRLDVITDIKRCIMASFSKDGFHDTNFEAFLFNAERNLRNIKLPDGIKILVEERLKKFKQGANDLEKRREDLLTIASLIQ